MEIRRILLDGYPTETVRDGDSLVAGDGRRVAIADATHLAPVVPTKIICIHLNYRSRVEEFMTKLPAAPTYFHKPVTALCGHGADVVRPDGCEWLNYEGEIAIVIGKTCRNVSPERRGRRRGSARTRASRSLTSAARRRSTTTTRALFSKTTDRWIRERPGYGLVR